MKSRIALTDPDLFLDGPGEYLAKTVCVELLKVEQWATLFGQQVYPYQREDFQITALPAARIYNTGYSKQSDSGFVDGNLVCDILLPPQLRREELEEFSSRISAALLQQFRRPEWFFHLEVLVPGLNQLGTNFDVDKALVFKWGDAEVPMIEIRIGFRIDLRIWDDYLTEQSRTKDEPFIRTLGELVRIANEIQGRRSDNETEVIVEMTTKV